MNGLIWFRIFYLLLYCLKISRPTKLIILPVVLYVYEREEHRLRVGRVTCIRDKINAYKILEEKCEEKRPLGRPRCRCEDIKMDLKNRMGMCGLDSSDSHQEPVVSCCIHGTEPSDSIKFREFFSQLSNYQILKEDCAL
jgi:hypothetical protein